MIRSLEAVIDTNGQVRLERPVQLDQPYFAIVTIIGPMEGKAVAIDEETVSPTAQPSESGHAAPDADINTAAFPSVAPLLEELEREAEEVTPPREAQNE